MSDFGLETTQFINIATHSLDENNLELNPILAPNFLNSSNASFPLSSPLLPPTLIGLAELLDRSKFELKMPKLPARIGVLVPEECEGGEAREEVSLGSISRCVRNESSDKLWAIEVRARKMSRRLF
jgi:hypothetical protein